MTKRTDFEQVDCNHLLLLLFRVNYTNTPKISSIFSPILLPLLYLITYTKSIIQKNITDISSYLRNALHGVLL